MKREIYLYQMNKAGTISHKSFQKRPFRLTPVVSRASIVTSNMAFLGVLLCACVQFTLQSSISEPVRVEEPALVNESGQVDQEVTGTRREIRSVSTSRKNKRGSSQVSGSCTCIFILYSGNLTQSQPGRNFSIIKQYSVSSKRVFIFFEK